jgi:DNA-binding Lrp family transcriptional regulator
MQSYERQVAQDQRDPLVRMYSRSTHSPLEVRTVPIDELDARIVAEFAAEPRVGVLECSRRLGVARGTVQARLERLTRDGVIRGWGPDLDPAAMGYVVSAFVTLEIRQQARDHPGATGGLAAHDAVAAALADVPEVLEAHTTTGAGDMLVRVVARSNADLQRVIDRVLAANGVVRASTVIALDTQISARVLPLLREAAGG